MMLEKLDLTKSMGKSEYKEKMVELNIISYHSKKQLYLKLSK